MIETNPGQVIREGRRVKRGGLYEAGGNLATARDRCLYKTAEYIVAYIDTKQNNKA